MRSAHIRQIVFVALAQQRKLSVTLRHFEIAPAVDSFVERRKGRFVIIFKTHNAIVDLPIYVRIKIGTLRLLTTTEFPMDVFPFFISALQTDQSARAAQSSADVRIAPV